MRDNVLIESSYDGFDWRLRIDGQVIAKGYTDTYSGAWRAARRRAKKIRKLSRTLDVSSLMQWDDDRNHSEDTH